jgi:hypothetical protein
VVTAGLPGVVQRQLRDRHRATLSEAVAETVANVVGCDPLDLPKPLYAAVDPDVLDRLFSGFEGALSLSFVYCEYRVTVRSEEAIVTDP